MVNASPATAYQFGFDPFAGQGVIVTVVDSGFAQTIGLQRGDFIREVNGAKISTTRDLMTAIQAGGHYWSLSIERQGHIINARFQG